jgi:PPOX class probable F420-dependent enzyme
MPTIPDTHRDLLDSPVAALATIDDDGYPQVTAVWFVYDAGDDRIRISLNTIRHKTKNLSARPRCSLFLLDPENPYRYLEVRGDARLDPDDDYVFADKVKEKYGRDLRTIDQPGEKRVAVTIEPVRIHAIKMG